MVWCGVVWCGVVWLHDNTAPFTPFSTPTQVVIKETGAVERAWWFMVKPGEVWGMQGSLSGVAAGDPCPGYVRWACLHGVVLPKGSKKMKKTSECEPGCESCRMSFNIRFG